MDLSYLIFGNPNRNCCTTSLKIHTFEPNEGNLIYLISHIALWNINKNLQYQKFPNTYYESNQRKLIHFVCHIESAILNYTKTTKNS